MRRILTAGLLLMLAGCAYDPYYHPLAAGPSYEAPGAPVVYSGPTYVGPPPTVTFYDDDCCYHRYYGGPRYYDHGPYRRW